VLVRYGQFKGKAKQRGIFFNISLEEFRKFCNDTGYIIKSGHRGMRYTIDRRDNLKGYVIGNIRLVTNATNINKYWNVDRYNERPQGFEVPEDYRDQISTACNNYNYNPEEDLPF